MKKHISNAKKTIITIFSRFQKPGIDFDQVMDNDLKINQQIALELTGSYRDKKKLKIIMAALLILGVMLLFSIMGVR